MPAARTIVFTLLCLLCAALAGCAGQQDPALPTVAPATSVTPSFDSSTTATTGQAPDPTAATGGSHYSPPIDAAVAPAVASLPAFDAASRPVGAAAAGGPAASFATAEIVVFGDVATAAGIASRFGGSIIRSTDPGTYGIGATPFHLVRVDPATADLDAIAEAIPQLGGSIDGLRFSDEQAARIVAIAAATAATGARVALNWVSTPTEIPFSTVEAAIGPDASFSTDAYQQDYYRLDTVAGFGVAEAWSSMHRAGLLDNRVPLAIIDGSFWDDPELAPYTAVSTVPGIAAIGEGLLDGYHHGSIAASIAMALPDNDYGVAGVAGVVAEPILVLAGTDIESSTVGLLEAYGLGARIISMSFVAPILDSHLPFAAEFDEVSAMVSSAGVLMFSSSGNGGGNLDEVVAAEDLLHGTLPCQSPGVLCVGGLASADSEERHEDSTYGNPGGSVDIYAPYCVFVGPDGNLTGVARRCGTSLSTPFAAGVAALVWASDPDLTAAEVWNLIESTAAGDRWPRIQAYDAVQRAIEGPMRIEIIEPTNRTQDLGRGTGLAATVTLYLDGPGSRDVEYNWRSNRDGVITAGSILVSLGGGGTEHSQRISTTATGLSEGTHTITVTAFLGSDRREDSITIDVVNSPPEPTITQPVTGHAVCSGESITFRGQAFDINEQLGIPESAFRWRSNVDGLIGNGSTVSTSGLSVGDHRILLRVFDSHGLDASTSVNVSILGPGAPGCENLAPSATITLPQALREFLVDPGDQDADGPYAEVVLRGVAIDPEGQQVTIRWYSSAEDPQLLGAGPEITVRLHMFGPNCEAETHDIEMRVSDGVNTVSDTVRVFVNQFC